MDAKGHGISSHMVVLQIPRPKRCQDESGWIFKLLRVQLSNEASNEQDFTSWEDEGQMKP